MGETSRLAYSKAGHSDFIATWQGAADLCRVILAPATVENGRARIAGYDRMFTLLEQPRSEDDCDQQGHTTLELLDKLERERTAIHGI